MPPNRRKKSTGPSKGSGPFSRSARRRFDGAGVAGRVEAELRSFLRAKGLRYTPERRRVLEAVLDVEGHFDVDELFMKLRAEGDRVSKATVYRTLALLCETGLLREHTFGERHQHYERLIDRPHHDHLVCTTCGRIIEFVDPAIERLQEKVCKRRGFRPEHHHLRIEGTCAECVERSAAQREGARQ